MPHLPNIKIPLNTARIQLKFQIDLDNHNDTIQKNINTKQQQVLGKNQQLHKILPFAGALKILNLISFPFTEFDSLQLIN